MLTLDKIIDRYKSNNLGILLWGGKTYYKINSDTPISLNATYNGFILDKNNRVQEFTIDESCNTKKKIGSTLKNYYPWPYFSKEEIKAFEVVRIQLFLKIGKIIKVKNNLITYGPLQCSIQISVKDCLRWPEFFKPIY